MLAGCASAVSVPPIPATDTPSRTAPTDPLTTAELAGTSPEQLCGLIDGMTRERLGLTDSGEPAINSIRNPECIWQTPQFRTVVSLFTDGFSIDDVQTVDGDTVSPAEIAGHRARIITATDPSAGCTVYIELTIGSYLEVGALDLPSAEGRVEECAIAAEMATVAITALTAGRPR